MLIIFKCIAFYIIDAFAEVMSIKPVVKFIYVINIPKSSFIFILLSNDSECSDL